MLAPQTWRKLAKIAHPGATKWLTRRPEMNQDCGQFLSNQRRSAGHFRFISGRRVSHFGPRDGRFSPILAIFGAPRRPISVTVGTLTRPILFDTGVQKGSILVTWRRSLGQFWFISGRQVSHFGPRDGRFSPMLAIFRDPRHPISVTVGTLNRPILVDTGAQKRSTLVTLEAVGGPILVHFESPSQPLWAPDRPIFANFGHFWGPKAPDFGHSWNANSPHLV